LSDLLAIPPSTVATVDCTPRETVCSDTPNVSAIPLKLRLSNVLVKSVIKDILSCSRFALCPTHPSINTDGPDVVRGVFSPVIGTGQEVFLRCSSAGSRAAVQSSLRPLHPPRRASSSRRSLPDLARAR